MHISQQCRCSAAVQRCLAFECLSILLNMYQIVCQDIPIKGQVFHNRIQLDMIIEKRLVVIFLQASTAWQG